MRTHLPEQLEDEPRERILYDPRRPDRAAAWDLLSGAPRVDGTGALEPKGLLGTLLLLLPPALAVAAHALALGLVGRQRADGEAPGARPAGGFTPSCEYRPWRADI